MHKEFADLYVAKMSSPFAAYLDDLVCIGDFTVTLGDATDGPGQAVHVGGRHVLLYNTDGSVDHIKLDRGQSFFDFVQENYRAVWLWNNEEIG